MGDESQVGKGNTVTFITASLANQGARNRQTSRGNDGFQVTPAAVHFTDTCSAGKSESKTRSLMFENFQVSNELLFVACVCDGIVMP